MTKLECTKCGTHIESDHTELLESFKASHDHSCEQTTAHLTAAKPGETVALYDGEKWVKRAVPAEDKRDEFSEIFENENVVKLTNGSSIQEASWRQLNYHHVKFYGKERSRELEVELTLTLAESYAPAYWTVGKLLGVRDDMHRAWCKALEEGFDAEAAKS